MLCIPMCVCVCVCVCVCTRARKHCIYTHASAYVYAWMYAMYVCKHAFVCMHAIMQVCTMHCNGKIHTFHNHTRSCICDKGVFLPLLYSYYFLTWSSIAGVIVVNIWELLLFKCGGKLVRERTRVPLSSWLNKFCFADDAAVVAATKKI